MTIDLHGIKHEDVSRVLDMAIWKCMNVNKSRLNIITGNSSEMKRLVKDTANEYGLNATDSIVNPSQLLIDFI